MIDEVAEEQRRVELQERIEAQRIRMLKLGSEYYPLMLARVKSGESRSRAITGLAEGHYDFTRGDLEYAINLFTKERRKSLPLRDAEIIRMYYLEKSNREIACSLGISEAVVVGVLCRVKKKSQSKSSGVPFVL
ncbi:MAG: hypothetical protein HQL37_08635 [Alphaproteobacteria bacterium]|nr:hypothetical protein [Alphaproteobacteria bacterium]